MSQFCCPICRGALSRREHSYTCPAGHNYDVARQGYVNLLRAHGAKGHGDDRLMVEARGRFLNRGFYAPLREALIALCLQYAPGESLSLLDLGCGEGYYTEGVLSALEETGRDVSAAGIDISRTALIAACRRVRRAEFAVASVASVPAADSSFDLLLNLFAPQSDAEFLRLLKPGGHLLCVFPLEDHLMGLKEAVYRTPYPNPAPAYAPEGFALREENEVRSKLSLECAEDIRDLFCMTPYYYKTGREDQAKLLALTRLVTPISFGLYLYEKQ